MKSDAQLAADAIGASQLDQAAFGLTISGASVPSGSGETKSTSADERVVRPIGEVSSDGKVFVISGGGGSTEIAAENTIEKSLKAEASAARELRQEGEGRSRQLFSAMASVQSWRAERSAPTRSKSAEREM